MIVSQAALQEASKRMKVKRYEYASGRIDVARGILQLCPSEAYVCPVSPYDAHDLREGSVISTIGGSTGVCRDIARLKFEPGKVYPLLDAHGGAFFLYATTLRVDNSDTDHPYLTTNSRMITDATKNSLALATTIGLGSIAFPMLGAGQGHMSLEDSLKLMLDPIQRCLDSKTSLKKVWIAVPNPIDYRKVVKQADKALR